MASEDTDSATVQTAETAFEVVEAIRSLDGARVTELASELDMAKSTVHRHLTTLHELNYLVKEDDQYDLGLQFLSLGEYVRTRKAAYARVQPKVTALAEETSESAQFLVPEGGKAVYVHRETGPNAVNTPNSRIGETIPLHATAAGKAILSCYPPEAIHDVVDGPELAAFTENTVTDCETLQTELEDIRNKGYSVNNEENVEGVYAVGVPIKRTDGHPIGALSVSGPAQRLKRDSSERELANLLLETANELELNIAYS